VNTDNFFMNSLNNISYEYLTSGFLLGLSVGYFLKKSFKLMLFILGLSVVGFFLFEHNTNIELDNGTILNSFDTILKFLNEFIKFIYAKVTNIETEGGAGAIAGFLFGLKIG